MNFEERDYGDITGKDKTELMEEFGKEQITVWRRSFYQGPPGGESFTILLNAWDRGYDEHIEIFIRSE